MSEQVTAVIVNMIMIHPHGLMITITTLCAHRCIFVDLHMYISEEMIMIQHAAFSLSALDGFPVTEKSFLPSPRTIRSDWLSHPGTGRRYANEALTKRLMEDRDK